MPNDQRLGQIAVIVALVAIAATVALFIFYQAQQNTISSLEQKIESQGKVLEGKANANHSNSNSNSNASSNSSSTNSDWVVYTDKANGFTLEHPSDIHIVKNPIDTALSYEKYFSSDADAEAPLEAAAGELWVTAKVNKNQDGIDLKTWVASFGTNYGVLSERNVTVNGKPALQLTFDTVQDANFVGEPAYGVETYWEVGNEIYSLSAFTDSSANFSKYQDTYDDMLDSFQTQSQ